MGAAVELGLAALIIVAGLLGYVPLSSTPFLLVVAVVFVWWRGPGWRAIGLRRPSNARLDPARGIAGVILMQFLPFADSKALAVYDAFERAVYQR